MRIGTCKLCRGVEPLVKAHIIPNSFYRLMLRDSNFALRLADRRGIYDGKIRTGLYDNSLVCDPCERLFSPLDRYGKEVLLDQGWPPDREFSTTRTPVAVRYEYDYERLKLFFMSILWRAGASQRREWAHLNIGPHLENVRERILASDPGDPDDFSVLTSRFQDPIIVGGKEVDPKCAFMDPRRTRIYGANCVRMYLADFTVWIKVDQRPFEHIGRALCMAHNRPLFVILRDFRTSGEFKQLCRMIRQRESRS